MAKKLLIIFLLSIYALSSFGIGIKQFYCCGKLKSVSVVFDNFTKQGCDKGDGKDGCCKNKFQYFKVKDTHFASNEVTAPFIFHSDPHLPVGDIRIEFVALQNEIAVNNSHSPPRTITVPIYISNCVFRI